jgi:endoglucanase
MVALMATLSVIAPPRADAVPQYPFPQHVTYAPGTIRPTVPAQAQQDADVRAYYDQWKADYVVAAGPGQYRIKFARALPLSAVTVSEGQGFGMVIVALSVTLLSLLVMTGGYWDPTTVP